ncbi:MAG: cysteine desulfurase [Chlamydiales bacterium]|nr:cysteine desulfurase [Chlamydiales bacterium]
MIYLDNNATTLLDPRVEEAMRSAPFGNPSSPHRFGQKARRALIEAKHVLLNRLAPGREIVFTSGGSEAIAMAIQSCEGRIVTTSLEHAAVLEACKNKEVTFLENLSQEKLPVDTKLIVLSAANNETGVKNDIEAAARFGIPLLVDGVAFLGKEEWKMPEGICAVAFSAHKIHGPKGVGCLIYDAKFPLKPLVYGAQQRGLRGGTENVAGIVGFAKAVECIDYSHIRELRDYFESELEACFDVVIHGKGLPRVCNTSSVAFVGEDAEMLLMQLDLAGVAVSFGAACSSGSLQLSHVLRNMGVPVDLIRSSLRFSLSRMTTKEELDACLNQLSKLLTPTDFTPSKLVSSAVSSN